MGDRLKMHVLASHRHAFLSCVIFLLFMHWRHAKSHKSNLYCKPLQKTQGYATYIDCAYPFPANVKAAFMCKNIHNSGSDASKVSLYLSRFISCFVTVYVCLCVCAPVSSRSFTSCVRPSYTI